MVLESLRKFSLEILQAKAADGNHPHLLSTPNLEDPSLRIVPVK